MKITIGNSIFCNVSEKHAASSKLPANAGFSLALLLFPEDGNDMFI
jgi:hypothetical protein